MAAPKTQVGEHPERLDESGFVDFLLGGVIGFSHLKTSHQTNGSGNAIVVTDSVCRFQHRLGGNAGGQFLYDSCYCLNFFYLGKKLMSCNQYFY